MEFQLFITKKHFSDNKSIWQNKFPPTATEIKKKKNERKKKKKE